MKPLPRPRGAKITENVYSANPAATVPQDRKEDAIFSYNDVVFTYKPTNAITVTAAPAFYAYLLHGSVGISGNAVGPGGRSDPNDVNTANPLAPTQGGLLNNAAFNSDEATDDLYVAMFDGDVKFPVGPLKGKFYYDFAYNLDGSLRAHHIYNVEEGSFQDSTTWLAGFQLGELKRKHDFYVSADYRQYGDRLHRPEPQRSELRAQPPEHAGHPGQLRLQHRPTGSSSRSGTTARGTWRRMSTPPTALC